MSEEEIIKHFSEGSISLRLLLGFLKKGYAVKDEKRIEDFKVWLLDLTKQEKISNKQLSNHIKDWIDYYFKQHPKKKVGNCKNSFSNWAVRNYNNR